MKLFIITSLKEHQPAVASIIHEAGIKIFSISATTGVKTERDNNLLDDWFATSDGEYDSIMLFSFTPEANATRAMQLITAHNQNNNGDFPVRAFIVPVEQSNY